MSKSVLLSIKPQYCELIASGKKTIEVRKTKPKLDTPFKCYIYCTKPSKKYQTICGCMILNSDELYRHPKQGIKYGDSIELMCCNDEYSEDNFLNGKVIGEFMCNGIIPISIEYSNPNSRIALKEFPYTCLTDKEIMDYLGNGKTGYGFHISDLVIYDQPRELSDFRKPCIYGEESDVSCFLCDKSGYRPDMHIDCFNEVTRPPQSWYYVEELI